MLVLVLLTGSIATLDLALAPRIATRASRHLYHCVTPPTLSPRTEENQSSMARLSVPSVPDAVHVWPIVSPDGQNKTKTLAPRMATRASRHLIFIHRFWHWLLARRLEHRAFFQDHSRSPPHVGCLFCQQGMLLQLRGWSCPSFSSTSAEMVFSHCFIKVSPSSFTESLNKA